MESKTYSMPEFAKFLIEKSELSIPVLADKLEVHRTTIYAWLKSQTQGVPRGRLELLRPLLLEKWGIRLGRVTNKTIEVLEGSKEQQLEENRPPMQQPDSSSSSTQQPFRDPFRAPDYFIDTAESAPIARREACTCGKESYIRQIELSVINLVHENTMLKAKLFDCLEKVNKD